VSASTTASLPMYDFPEAREATDAWWAGLRGHLIQAGLRDVPERLLRRDDLIEQWTDPLLVMSQTCGYLLTHQLRGAAQCVATPHYRAPGCVGAQYASVILARADHPGREPADFRGSVAVYSRLYSHAGYNSLRGVIAPLAAGQRFFSQVVGSGSHVASIEALAGSAADIGAIDCIVYAFVRRFRPSALHGTRTLGFTPLAPAPPYIVPGAVDAGRVARVREALRHAMADTTLEQTRRELFIEGFSFTDASSYAAVDAVESAAQRLGYPELH
jgi:ABC-type phosphate/phosphonate transport system substrate-binding protein